MSVEHEENWDCAYEEKRDSEILENANVVSSRTIFIIKILDHGECPLKGRITVHGNRDS